MSEPWLITGATDGVGRALARHCLANGQEVIMVGRKALAELNQEIFLARNYCQADLSRPEAAERIGAFLEAQAVTRLRGVIHNAALGWVGDLAEQSAEDVEMLTEVNLVAPIRLTQALWNRTQRVVFISSIVADFPSPRYAVYAATKGALDALARSLRAEGGGPHVQTLHLGAVRSGFHAKAGMNLADSVRDKFPTPESAARWIAGKMEGGNFQATMGLKNNMIRGLSWLLQAPFSFGLPWRFGAAKAGMTVSSGKHAVVTGSSQGIGAAIADLLRLRGYTVTGVDLALQGAEVRADLSQSEGVSQLLETLATLPPIDLLIHNAGINATRAFAGIEESKWLPVVQVNFLAPMVLTLGLLQRNRLAKGGTVVCISSLSHYSGYPGASVYAATKSGLAAYASSLRAAFKPTSLQVLTVFPGPTRTAHAREHSPDNSREHRRMDPAELAQRILRAAEGGKARLVPGFGNKVSAWLGWLAPGMMSAMVRKLLFEKMKK